MLTPVGEFLCRNSPVAHAAADGRFDRSPRRLAPVPGVGRAQRRTV